MGPRQSFRIVDFSLYLRYPAVAGKYLRRSLSIFPVILATNLQIYDTL